jgi:hypothetical protein
MTEINITEVTKKPREIFTAQFDRYDFDRQFRRIYFNNVRNEKGVLVKEFYWISAKNGKNNNWDSFEKEIQEIFLTYEDNIDNIDFQINTEKVKNDIMKITNKFLKKKKL